MPSVSLLGKVAGPGDIPALGSLFAYLYSEALCVDFIDELSENISLSFMHFQEYLGDAG